MRRRGIKPKKRSSRLVSEIVSVMMACAASVHADSREQRYQAQDFEDEEKAIFVL